MVVINAPFVSESKLFKGQIEGNTVTIPFSIDYHPVLVEENGFYFTHIYSPYITKPRSQPYLLGFYNLPISQKFFHHIHGHAVLFFCTNGNSEPAIAAVFFTFWAEYETL